MNGWSARRRFRGDDVERGAGDLSALERIRQRLLVDQAAARRVDEDRRARHLRELRRGDHVARRGRQRAVQRDDVARAQHVLERRVQRAHAGHALVAREQHAHAERAPDAGDRLPERAVADDAERRARESADRVVEVAELPGPLPGAVGHRLPVGADAAPQREDQRERVLGHRVHRVVADVRHDDAARRAGGDVDDVVAGGRDRRPSRRRGAAGDRVGAHRHLVRDHDVGVRDARGDVGGRRGCVHDERVRKRERAQRDRLRATSRGRGRRCGRAARSRAGSCGDHTALRLRGLARARPSVEDADGHLDVRHQVRHDLAQRAAFAALGLGEEHVRRLELVRVVRDDVREVAHADVHDARHLRALEQRAAAASAFMPSSWCRSLIASSSTNVLTSRLTGACTFSRSTATGAR